MILPALLRGKLQDFYATLNDDEKKDLATLKRALSARSFDHDPSLVSPPLAMPVLAVFRRSGNQGLAQFLSHYLLRLPSWSGYHAAASASLFQGAIQ